MLLRIVVLLLLAAGTGLACAAGFAPGIMGEVVTARGDETLLEAGTAAPRRLNRGQTLRVGDEIRTGAFGGAAILFRDGTLMRVHRLSRLEVGEIRDASVAQSRFRLLAGAVWARAQAGFRSLSAGLQANRPTVLAMETPAATIGIRGTDWHVAVDPAGKTVLTVIEGNIDFGNALGQLEVAAGERGVAEPGKPPRKLVLVDLKGKPLLASEVSLRWFEWLRLTEAPSHAAILAEDARLEAVPESARTPQDWLALTRTRLDRMQPEAAAEALAQAGAMADSATGQLLKGLIEAWTGHPERALPLFEVAMPALGASDALRASLALAGLEFVAGRYTETRAALKTLAKRHPDSPDVLLYQALLQFFANDTVALRRALDDAQARFPSDARFSAVGAFLARAQGDEASMRRFFEQALALDPENPLALTLAGDYSRLFAPDQARAAASYARVLAATRYPEALNNQGLLFSDLGDFAAAEAAYRASMAAAPDTVAPRINLALLYVDLDRLAEARAILADISPDDPVAGTARLVEGVIALAEGNSAGAVETLERAVVSNPSTPESYTALAVAHYQRGDFAAADAALTQSRRADPDDPTPLLLSSLVAQDQARIGEAIRYSRRALRRIRRLDRFAVDDLANTRSGASNVGGAYATLGLTDWGRFYTQRAFSPYDPSGHLLLSNVYRNARARAAEAGQGLLLDALSIAGSNRYYDFIRRPAHYLTVGGSGGFNEGAQTDSASGTLQGFLRLPQPVAYTFAASRNNDDGFRSNGDRVTEQVIGAVGTRFNDAQDQVSLLFLANRAAQDEPGTLDAPDPDDESRLQNYSGSLGWHHRFSYANRLMARVSAASTLQRALNRAPFGLGLDPVTYGLVDRYGLEAVRALSAQGIYDLRPVVPSEEQAFLMLDTPDNAQLCVLSAEFCSARYAPLLPARLDAKRFFQSEEETHQLDFQLRHLFDPAPNLSATWGLEWTPQVVSARLTQLQQQLAGTTFLITDFVGFITDGTGALPAPFGPLVSDKADTTRSTGSTHAFAQIQWRDRAVQPALALEAGISWRDYDGLRGTTASGDPRIGLAWAPHEQHWLRIAWQRELSMPRPMVGTLAPVGVNGLVPGERLSFFDGEQLESGILRWDAEWTAGLFSHAQVEHQELEGLSRLDELSLGLNTWFLERFGAAITYRLSDSRQHQAGPNRGLDVPLLAAHELDAGVTFIHPRQIVVSLTGRYVGERPGDAANQIELSDYFTMDLSASWQPLARRWSFGLGLTNLLDSQHDVLRGVPAPGVGAVLSVERRF